MEYKNLIFEVNEYGVAIIRLNRPETLNAFNKELVIECIDVFHKVNKDNSIRVIVLTGSKGAFCAGGDINWLLASKEPLQKKEIMDYTTQMVLTIDKVKKPIIGCVNGVAAGAGTAMVLGCDIIYASEDAKFAPNFVHIAAVPDSGCSWFLPRKIGYHRACELFLTGRILDAKDAYDMGIYNKIFPGDKLEEETMRLAKRLSYGPVSAMQAIKAMVKMSFKNDLSTQLDIEAYYQVMAWCDSDFIEGVNAFFEKRKPNFKR
ncbi:2-(1,2-epoxy-1,2-dihydrophenyl)acetyl-CoA isomerase PaaG [Desulfothermus okinawensis JCM 13304]